MATTEDTYEVPRLSTGVPGLDEILCGGLPAHHVYLVEGGPGSGKTTLSLQFLLEGVRLGEVGLYVTLSETRSELLSVAHSHGWEMDEQLIFEMAARDEGDLPEGHYTFFYPSEVELGQSTQNLTDQVEKVGAVRVVFDSLAEMQLMAREPLRYRRQIVALRNFFLKQRCTVILLDDPTTETPSNQPRSLAHGVIRLEKMMPEFGKERRRLQVMKLRGTSHRGGYHDFKIDRGGMVAFPRLIAAEHKTFYDLETVSSGVKQLDKLVGGGLEFGSSTLVTGPTGVGKTSVVISFVKAALAQGHKASLFLFDEAPKIMLDRARRLGSDLSSYIDQGTLGIHEINPGELSPGEFTHNVRLAVEQFGAEVVVVDSLDGYLAAMPEERFLILQMHELLNYLHQKGILTLLVSAQHGLMGPHNLKGDINVSYLTDNVILLRFFEAKGIIHKAISVLKSRVAENENAIREFTLGTDGMTVGEPLVDFQGILSGNPIFSGEVTDLIDRANLNG